MLERLFVAPAVKKLAVREEGLAGTLFLPGGNGPHPGVIVVGGSRGGLRENQAALPARRSTKIGHTQVVDKNKSVFIRVTCHAVASSL